jgi:hypothetical protein
MKTYTNDQLIALGKEAAARKEKERRYWTKQKLILRKAAAAGITVSEAEIDAELKKK